MKKLFNSIRLFLFTILIGSTFFHALGQTSATIDYRFYTTKAHPYMIPELPSGSDFNLLIKTGHPIYITITGVDKGSSSYYLDRNGMPRSITGDTILLGSGDAGNGLINYKVSNVSKTLGFHINYQADLQDQTIGSATYGDYPDFIWVAQGGSTVVSAGKYMNPSGSTISGYYKWKGINDAAYVGTYTDSVRIFGKGAYIGRINDGTGYWTNDTISILEKPTFNSTAKTLNFATTTNGITYKLLKVASISGTDTTWTETQNFVGEGNIKNITLTDGKYKLTTTLGIHTAVYPYGYFVVSTPPDHATIDFKPYTTKAHPYMIPELPSGSEFYLLIKTGHPIYISITGMDKGSGYYHWGTGNFKSIAGDTILIDAGDVGHCIVTFSRNGTDQAIILNDNYQADLQDQTISSTTYGDYPDFIWVAHGGSALVSAGKYMAGYKWMNINGIKLSTNPNDSINNLGFGQFVIRTVDASLTTIGTTQDTISILEKPTFNSTAKTLNFPTTTNGITYKLLKVASISGTDTTWTETQNFVGDGNVKNLSLTDGKYKLITTLGIHTAVYPYGYFVVGVSTALNKTKVENINYRLVDNKLQFDNEVNFKFYSLKGQLLQQEQGNSFKLCRQAGIFKATDKNGNVLTAKIILK